MSVDTLPELPVASGAQTSAAPATPVRARDASRPSWLQILWPPAVAFVIFLAIWYLYSAVRYDIKAQRVNGLPYPHEILVDGFMPWWDAKNGFRSFIGNMWPTIRVTFVGLGISIGLGVLIAVVMNAAKSFERAIYPYAVVAQTVPILAITPLLRSLFGEEFGVRVIIVVLIALFPVITNTLFGLQSADRLHHDLFTLNRSSRWTRLWKLELPGAVPAMMAGIRIASGGAVIGAVVADFFFTRGEKGIGYYIFVKQKASAERPEMFAATIVASLFGVAMFLLIGFITNRAIRNWHDSVRPRST
jgi:NitT/TauT family transport system permease protein